MLNAKQKSNKSKDKAPSQKEPLTSLNNKKKDMKNYMDLQMDKELPQKSTLKMHPWINSINKLINFLIKSERKSQSQLQNYNRKKLFLVSLKKYKMNIRPKKSVSWELPAKFKMTSKKLKKKSIS